MDGDCTDNGHSIKASADGGHSWLTYMTGLNKGTYKTIGYSPNSSCFYTFDERTSMLYEACQTVISAIGNPRPAQLSFRIYPNPAENQLQIKMQKWTPGITFSIFNILGEKLSSAVIYQDDQNINISNLKSGIYYIRLEGENATGTMKFVKN
jgi:hypothetical protein